MTTYQVSGATVTIAGDGQNNSANILMADSINPITGKIGVNTVRIMNSSTANIATVGWLQYDTTYDFANVAYTTDSANGANAVINVNVSYDAYAVTFVDEGVDFLDTETITVLGSSIGGADTTNDLVITITSVSNVGAITGSTIAGTVAWPQGTANPIQILPMSENFIQISNIPIDSYISGFCDDGNIFVTPVSIVTN